MVEIAIIEDQKEMLESIKQSVQNFSKPHLVHIVPYLDGNKFLDDIMMGIRYDIVFCDIEMPKITGIEVGRRLMERWPTTYLIYLTAYDIYAVDSYIVAAYQYILKKDMQTRLPAILEKLLAKIEKEKNECHICRRASELVVLRWADVLCIKKNKQKKSIQYNTVNGDYDEYNTIDSILQELKALPEFVQVSRDCIVNLKHVYKVTEMGLILTDKSEILVSRRRMAKVKDTFHSVWGNL